VHLITFEHELVANAVAVAAVAAMLLLSVLLLLLLLVLLLLRRIPLQLLPERDNTTVAPQECRSPWSNSQSRRLEARIG